MSSDRLPPPPKTFEKPLYITRWLRPIIRIHHSQFGATEFNPGRGSGGRFDPLRDEDGAIVPTLYGSNTLDGALSETVFHDVPLRGDDRRVAASVMKPLLISTLQARRPLHLIDLHFGLLRVRVLREQLIDTDAYEYPATRAWAAALYRAAPAADGMVWRARYHPSAESILLFGTAVLRGDLEVIAAPKPLAPSGNVDPDVLACAEAAGILIVRPS